MAIVATENDKWSGWLKRRLYFCCVEWFAKPLNRAMQRASHCSPLFAIRRSAIYLKHCIHARHANKHSPEPNMRSAHRPTCLTLPPVIITDSRGTTSREFLRVILAKQHDLFLRRNPLVTPDLHSNESRANHAPFARADESCSRAVRGHIRDGVFAFPSAIVD